MVVNAVKQTKKELTSAVIATLQSHFATSLIATTFLVSAVAKMLDWSSLLALISKFGVSSQINQQFVAIGVVLVELVTVMSIFWCQRILTSATLAILGFGITGFSIWRKVSGFSKPCHCFGNLLELSSTQELVIGAIVLLLSILHYYKSDIPTTNRRSARQLRLLFSIIALTGTATIFLLLPHAPSVKDLPVFGNVRLDTPLGNVTTTQSGTTVAFELTNLGNQPVKVTAHPSCGCARGTWDSTSIKPHSTIGYQTAGSKPEFVYFQIESSTKGYLYGRPRP
jgi:hypothetical protein